MNQETNQVGQSRPDDLEMPPSHPGGGFCLVPLGPEHNHRTEARVITRI